MLRREPQPPREERRRRRVGSCHQLAHGQDQHADGSHPVAESTSGSHGSSNRSRLELIGICERGARYVTTTSSPAPTPKRALPVKLRGYLDVLK